MIDEQQHLYESTGYENDQDEVDAENAKREYERQQVDERLEASRDDYYANLQFMDWYYRGYFKPHEVRGYTQWRGTTIKAMKKRYPKAKVI